MMAQAKRIYILMIKINSQVDFLISLLCFLTENNRKHNVTVFCIFLLRTQKSCIKCSLCSYSISHSPNIRVSINNQIMNSKFPYYYHTEIQSKQSYCIIYQCNYSFKTHSKLSMNPHFVNKHTLLCNSLHVSTTEQIVGSVANQRTAFMIKCQQ